MENKQLNFFESMQDYLLASMRVLEVRINPYTGTWIRINDMRRPSIVAAANHSTAMPTYETLTYSSDGSVRIQSVYGSNIRPWEWPFETWNDARILFHLIVTMRKMVGPDRTESILYATPENRDIMRVIDMLVCVYNSRKLWAGHSDDTMMIGKIISDGISAYKKDSIAHIDKDISRRSVEYATAKSAIESECEYRLEMMNKIMSDFTTIENEGLHDK